MNTSLKLFRVLPRSGVRFRRPKPASTYKPQADVLLTRKYPLPSPSLWWFGGVPPRLTELQQVFEEVAVDSKDDNQLKVLLTSDVPGLGTMGTVSCVHRNRFWRYLYPCGLAELPTDERILHFKRIAAEGGIVIEESVIGLPPAAITRKLANQPFHVTVMIDNIKKVDVACKIFIYQKLDNVTCTQPPTNVFKPFHLDDWISDFPEEELRLP